MPWNSGWFDEARSRRHHYEAYAVFIVVILVVGFVVDLYRQQSGAADRTACSLHLRRLAQGALMYSQDYDGNYPLPDDWVRSLTPYVDRLEFFFCPADKEIRLLRKKKGTRSILSDHVSYWYIQPRDALTEPSMQPIYGDRMFFNLIGNHDFGGNVAYVDGHVQWRTLDQWQIDHLPLEDLSPDRKR